MQNARQVQDMQTCADTARSAVSSHLAWAWARKVSGWVGGWMGHVAHAAHHLHSADAVSHGLKLFQGAKNSMKPVVWLSRPWWHIRALGQGSVLVRAAKQWASVHDDFLGAVTW